MPEVYFNIKLSVRPKKGGRAEFEVPKVLQDMDYNFVIVNDSGEEGIIKLKASESDLKRVEKDKSCVKLTSKQMEKQKESYPRPKLKSKYRMQTQIPKTEGIEKAVEDFKVDDRGNRIIDTIQTVRAGFYLIDVKVLSK